MIGIAQREEIGRLHASDVLRKRQNGRYGCVIDILDPFLQRVKVVTGERFVDHQVQVGNLQLARYIHRHGSALKVLLVRPQGLFGTSLK